MSHTSDIRPVPEADRPIAYMQRTRDWYLALGYGNPYVWAHYTDVPFRPLKKPLARLARDARHHRGALSARQGRPGPGRGLQRRGQVLPRLLRRHRSGPRPAHLACRDRPQAHQHGGQRHLVSAAGAAAAGRERAGSASLAAFTARRPTAASSTPSSRGLPRDPRALRGRRGGRRTPRAQLPGLPPDREPDRAPSRSERHRDRRDGLRQGHRRALRRAAIPVQRLPARQQRRQAARPCDRRPSRWSSRCACSSRHRGPRTTVQSPLRWSEDADWKLDYCNHERLAPEEIGRLRAESDRARETARGIRETRPIARS